MKEVWRDIKGYEGSYQVSNKGRVRSLPRTLVHKNGYVRFWPGIILKHDMSDKGYPQVSLCKKGSRVTRKVHQLVAWTFLGDCPPNMEVCHKDGTHGNCQLDNLRYGTRKENDADKDKHGVRPKGSKHGRSLLTESDIRAIRKLFGKMTIAQIAKRYGVCSTTISFVKSGKNWSHVK